MVRAMTVLVLAAAFAAVPAKALCQADEEAAVMAVVEAMFDAMRAGDSTAFRAVLHPSATGASAFVREGEPTLAREASLEGFVQAVGTPHDQVWDERIWDAEVRIDGLLATVWTPYAFYLGEELSHCGVDAFQLFKGQDGWKVFHIADTRRREGCEVPGD
ncbi:MAG TPA: nuclear transport factor 2 family protein [Gemmatimonadota bacterium]|nr:nuclear transport factor 2 family protein [Gemmatimonadota bacterium]